MKKLVTSIALIAAMAGFGAAASAAEEAHDMAAAVEHAAASSHYPIIKPHNLDWSFAGPFGKYDKASCSAA